MISLFDMFKVGIGPSSSHTVGPMKAGKQFVDDLVEKGLLDSVTRVAVDVYGSLSLTGKGHHTDIAIIMGLAGNEPATVDIDSIPGFIRDVEERERLLLAQGRHEVDFPRDNGMRFHNGNLPLHENGMQIHAYNGDEVVYSKTYYSIGGGFIVDEEHFGQDAANEVSVRIRSNLPPNFSRTVMKPAIRCLVSLCKTNWHCTARKRSTSISRMSGKPCRHVSIAG